MFARLQLAVLAVAAVVLNTALSQPVQNCARSYVVQPGDFCDKISDAKNVSTFQLALVNQGVINTDCSNLFVDENICLGLVGQDCTSTHTIVSGDFCFAIAQIAGIALDTLLANNPNVNQDCSNIYPGEVLCTAATVIPYSTS
ncbi:hypothetical protein NLI96_g11528 [Meripilus lineatus]|uniref:LysM domain-containing protein n=1 Tax=Meripilus lineatus TaxID=2056292 RepID=A0AAD5YAR0_9APHY|nr:hypothetical protein NLI96_g11528 [Physisporinus lineatus]